MKTNVFQRSLFAAACATILNVVQIPLAGGDDKIFIPAFEFRKWNYQSFLILPTSTESSARPGEVVTARKWAMGTLTISDSPDYDNGYAAAGFLDFAPGVRLNVMIKGNPGKGDVPATFETKGVGVQGVTKGAEYQLTGWVFAGADGKVESVKGSVRLVSEPESNPNIGLGKQPLGTVGYFVINKAK